MSTYGTLNHNGQLHDNVNHVSSEQDALLPGKRRKSPLAKRFKNHLTVDVSREHSDLLLLLCYVITGLLDSCATEVWGSFVSMQTGNTIYFGLGVANPQSGTRWIKAGTSIACFCFGSFCFSHYHRYLGPRKRWVLTLSFIVQVSMITASAVITLFTQDVSGSDHDLHWHVLLPMALIAFQSSGQAVTSRVLEQGGLTSVVLTSNYCDLFSDVKLFAWPSDNAQRNRRIAAPVLLLLGAIAGGRWSRSEVGLAGALWTAVVLKSLIVMAWLFWRKDAESTLDEEAT